MKAGKKKETNTGVTEVRVKKVIFLAAGLSSRPLISPDSTVSRWVLRAMII